LVNFIYIYIYIYTFARKNENNVDDINNVRREASSHFMNKQNEYLKAKIDELENNSKIEISETCIGASVSLRWATSFRTNIVKGIEKNGIGWACGAYG